MRPTTALQSVVATAIVAMLLAACSSGSEGDKAGGGTAPVTLRMVTVEGRGAPYADGVAEFARQVEDLSAGSLRMDIVWSGAVEYFGAFGPRADQKVAGLVQDGELDLALIPARAWDELGVTSLQALQAPFLVSSEDLVEQVVQSELAGEMLAGLDQAGVVGLALLPDGLRHPVGFARPLLRPEDFAGATIRTLPSNASYRLVEALGAKPVDIWGDALSFAMTRGEIDGAESGFGFAGALPVPGTFTANITLYPKVNALVVNEAVFSRVSDEHREILREAATNALRYVVREAPTEAEQAAVYCRNGGAIAYASSDDVEELERTAQPVYGALEADPQTRELIERIRAMKAQLSSAGDGLPEACAASTGPAAPATSSSSEASEFPEGVYRAELTTEYLIAHGMDRTAYDIGGIHTQSFQNGRWEGHISVDTDPAGCRGTYTVEGSRVSVVLNPACGGESAGTELFNARWTLAGHELRLMDVHSESDSDAFARALWGSKPWTKID